MLWKLSSRVRAAAMTVARLKKMRLIVSLVAPATVTSTKIVRGAAAQSKAGPGAPVTMIASNRINRKDMI